RARARLLRFECLDLFEPVDDSAADLQVARPLTQPPPSLQRARRDAPSARELDLIEVLDRPVGHADLLGRCRFRSVDSKSAMKESTLSAVASVGERPRRKPRMNDGSPTACRPNSVGLKP